MGFPRLLSIFYCTFHPDQGPKVLYEVPEGSILSKTSPLVDFDSISEYLIPKVELCSKLVTISTPTSKVMGFPINLEHKKFQRNALMFNLAFVFDKDAETSSYEPVVRKMARVLKALEKESEFLSRQTRFAMMSSGASMSQSSVLTAPSATAVTTSKPNGAVNSSNTQARAIATTTTSSEHQQANGGGVLDTILEGSSATSLSDVGANSFTQASEQGANGSSTSSPSSQSNALEVPADSNACASSLPTSLPPVPPSAALTSSPPVPQTSNNIMSAALVSSPPSMSGSTITSAFTAPPSSSPFPSSKQLSNGQKATPSLVSLLQQEQADGSGMQNLIEQLIEDLNSYCECQIPIDSANTINLKLFPTYPNPASVYDYQVPISTVNLEALTDVNWDMTMQRITGYINGVNSVKRIAEYADVDTGLARMCMQHLLYYGCIIMVDLFQFKNIYAVKLEMMRLTEDTSLQHECVSYVTLPDMYAPSFAKIFSLYCSLQYGVVLQDWIEQNQISDYNIDVRRFISFGVIKGFLYRVHKYPILDYHDPAAITATSSGINSVTSITKSDAEPSVASIIAAPSTVGTTAAGSRPGTPTTVPHSQKKIYGDTLAPVDQSGHSSHQQHSHVNDVSSSVAVPPALRRLLNGEHHYDELCTMFGCSVREMDQILATDSRVKFIFR